MLEGLEIAELSLQKAVNMYGESRWDSEYYKKEFVADYNRIRQYPSKLLSDYSKYIRKGIFDISPEYYQTNGVPLIRTSEIKEPTISFNTTVFLSENINNQFQQTVLKPNDLVFTKIGAYIGDVAILPPTYATYNFSQNVAGVSLMDANDGPHLLAFFLTHFGQNQIKRSAMLSGQGKLELEDIRHYIIPNICDKIKSKIKQVIDLSIKLNAQQRSMMQCATKVLLEELKLCNWQPSEESTAIRTFSFAHAFKRWDAEYYQPKYESCKNIIERYDGGFKSISNICNIIDTTYQPQNGVTYKYIELANIGKNGEITGYTQGQGEDLPSRARRIVRTGDVIVSSVEGSLQSCAIIPEELDGALCSTGFYVIRSSFYTPESLLVLFKSMPIQMLLKKGCTGSILSAIGKTELEKITLPLIDKTTQIIISQQVQQSFELRAESKRLLEVAKRTVEIAIEVNEEKAIQYINDYGKSLYDK